MKRKNIIYTGAIIIGTCLSFTSLASCSRNKKIEPMQSEQQNSSQFIDLPTPAGVETTTFEVNNVKFKMVTVKGGTFMMGSNASDVNKDQRPAHKVTVSDFSIGQLEVTQVLWRAVMSDDPSEFSGKNLPVDNVTWEECQRFVTILNQIMHETGQLTPKQNFHLPTEAQWEFAARGGNNSKGYKYAGSNDISAVAWTRANAGDKTHSVASKTPNELGLYDMSGNVWEWVQDWYAPYSASEQTDPINSADKKSGRVIKRGGSWYYAQEERFTPSFRYGYYTDVTDSSIGMRLCLSRDK